MSMKHCRRLKIIAVVLLLGSWAVAQSAATKNLPPATTPPLNQCLGYAQHPDLRPGTAEDRPMPTVTFRLEMASFNPSYFGIAVESTGRAAYVSEPQTASENAPGEPYMVKFTMSEETRQRIFELARE